MIRLTYNSLLYFLGWCEQKKNFSEKSPFDWSLWGAYEGLKVQLVAFTTCDNYWMQNAVGGKSCDFSKSNSSSASFYWPQCSEARHGFSPICTGRRVNCLCIFLWGKTNKDYKYFIIKAFYCGAINQVVNMDQTGKKYFENKVSHKVGASQWQTLWCLAFVLKALPPWWRLTLFFHSVLRTPTPWHAHSNEIWGALAGGKLIDIYYSIPSQAQCNLRTRLHFSCVDNQQEGGAEQQPLWACYLPSCRDG